MTDTTGTEPLDLRPDDLLPENVLPHAHPMILLDEILDYGDQFAVALVRPELGKPFADDTGCVPVWVGMEYMAQTIGAYAGIQSQRAGEAVKIGFLLGTRAYDCSLDQFCCGRAYWVRVEKVYEGDGLSSFECTIAQPVDEGNLPLDIREKAQKENIVARAIINTFQPDDIQAFMEAQKT